MKPHFEWNPEKAKVNLQKHQVNFDEASTIFDDPQFISFLDEEHSTDEERYITMVAHTDCNDNIWIISARKVTKHEEKFYQEAG
jgi:uncharacterized DUF497 family protein